MNINETISFLLDPDGIGFPLLIGAGLGVILYLMHASSKADRKAGESVAKQKAKEENRLPVKPF